MKKLFLFSVFAAFSVVCFAQTKVAVYVTTSDNIEMSMRKIIGSQLVSAIVENKRYSAVERTTDFLNQISKEQKYQMSGNVDDNQISELGKQFGVNKVCVADVMVYKSSYYVQARLIDVENATIEATSEEILINDDLPEIVRVAKTLASKLVGNEAEAKIAGKHYSTCAQQKSTNCDIISIDNTGQLTCVTFKYIATTATSIGLDRKTYILDKESQRQYFLVSVKNLDLNNMTPIGEGITTFSAYFEKMPESTYNIEIIEPSGWTWKQITLRPYGRANYFEFQDLTETKYQTQKQKEVTVAIEREKARQKELEVQNSVAESIGAIGGLIANAHIEKHPEQYFYYLKFVNNHSSPRKIYIEGKYIGQVSGYSSNTFKLNLTMFGNIKSVQASGYLLSPNVEKAYIPKQAVNATYTIQN